MQPWNAGRRTLPLFWKRASVKSESEEEMMKKVLCLVLTLCMVLALAACGKKNAEAPDLVAYYANFEASLGEDNTPMVMDANEEGLVDQFYPGLSDYSFKQSVIKLAAMNSVVYEFALLECEKEEDVEAVKGILQTRIDNQVSGGAFYPETIEGWKTKSHIVSSGNYVMLAVGDSAAAAVERFEGLFA